MKNWMRFLIYLLLLTVAIGAIYVAVRETPIHVDIATATVGPMQVNIKEEGVTRVRNVYRVYPPITGHLERISLEEGDAVVENQTVVGSIHPLDPPFIDNRTANEIAAAVEAARTSVTLAEVDLSRAQADLNLAEVEYQRSLELQRTDVISKAALDKKLNVVLLKRAEVDSAKAAIRLRNAELRSVEARQIQPTNAPPDKKVTECCIQIMAPVSGTVLKINHKSEQVIQTTMPILEIGNPKDLEIAVDLLSSDAVKVKPGSKAIISQWGDEQLLHATVRRVDPAGFVKVSALGIEEQRVNVVLDIQEAPQRLGHGYRVYASFVIWTSDETLQLPIGSLFRRNGKWSVFVIKEDRATVKHVDLGQMNDTHAQVISGINAGDHVILYPNDQLDEGSLVEKRKISS
ncbi:MAG: efflux RND transporter periplasmic adaptor subunit [Rhizobiaceae bacterium]